jgi:hypothetical protein
MSAPELAVSTRSAGTHASPRLRPSR